MKFISKKSNLQKFMTKKPYVVNENMPAAKALAIMNEKKITSLCVHKNSNRNKTIGILHIHKILESNIS